jgi:mevalonate kinase
VKNLDAGKNTMENLRSPEKIPLVIANTGITASTTEVVADVRRLKESNPEKFENIFKEYKVLSEKAKSALLESDKSLICKLMNQNHKLLQDITVSSEINDKLVEIALDNGALGAKLTGTGRGGLVIALTKNEKIQEKISKAIKIEGYESWKTMIG